MSLSKNHRLLLLSAFPFILAATDSAFYGNLLAITANAVMAAANLAALFWIEKKPGKTQLILGILNAAMAFLTAWMFDAAGKQYLPVAWVLVGILFAVMAVLAGKKPVSAK